MNQYIFDALDEEQGLCAAALANLKSELNYLRVLVAGRLLNQRKSISWELAQFQEQNSRSIGIITYLPEQVNIKQENQLIQLTKFYQLNRLKSAKQKPVSNLIKSETR
jgi:hypothetical protein